MSAAALIRAAATQPCLPVPRHVLDEAGWREMARALAHEPTLDLLAMWADTGHVHALFDDRAGSGEILLASTPVGGGRYAALSPARMAATCFERMIHDLWGHVAEGARDLRPWLDHGRWEMSAPMAQRPTPAAGNPEPPSFHGFEGDSLHQVAIGPVHAGIIEPGHFRFTAQGETVARLEVRLGYAHKGILVLMRGKSPRVAARFAARLSGDSTVAHGIAFARAAEAATTAAIPARAESLRAVMAEMERIANHLGDLGAVGQDAGFAPMPARCLLLREAMLEAARAAFGHRLMMDAVIPGGVAGDIAPDGAAAILCAIDAVAKELPRLLDLFGNVASLADRTVGTGIIRPSLAARMAAGGFVGRASGRACDLRVRPGYAPYDRLAVQAPLLIAGDVDARLRIRAAEIDESIRLLRVLLDKLPAGEISFGLPMVSGEGLGWAEGFRGDIWHWLRLDGGLIASVFLRDPSWLHWPLLEAAIEGNVLADFPLINKSINGSYSGVDL